ncbi:MAG: hypothetical protein ACPHK0_03280 [Dehalococcoidia bacterium]
MFLRRLGEPGLMASGHTTHVLSVLVRQDALGTPSDVPVPRNTILAESPDLLM